MMKPILLSSLLALVFSGFIACAPSRGASAKFQISPKKAADRVELKSGKNGSTVFEVFSPGGIGEAEIKLVSGTPPQKIVLRFYLKGLEELRITAGNTALLISVSSHGDQAVHQSIRMENADSVHWQQIDSGSQYWTEIRMVDTEGKPANKIPLKNGYFEAVLPQNFINDKTPVFSLRWIDFYRE